MKIHAYSGRYALTVLILLGQLRAMPVGVHAATDQPELIFQSGFEGTTTIVPGDKTDAITGSDPALLLSDWLMLQTDGMIGTVCVNYTGGTPNQRYAKVVPEPGKPTNRVLQFWLNDFWRADGNQAKARVQVEFYGIKGGFKEFYQSIRVYLSEDFNVLKTYPKAINWCTLAEFWNNEWWIEGERHGFRVTLGVGKPSAAGSELNFILNAENPGQKEVWAGNNPTIKVPVGQWFTLEYYFKEGDRSTGRFWMAITPESGRPQVVFDIHNITYMNEDPAPNGVTGYNPMKLYTSQELVSHVKAQGKTLQVLWDDLKLWKNKRPE
ncbi:MAG: hypothetical protein PSV13_17645 [Lacunisphaera sp.]|nr:hypothetical protein [Lacunisphaera sp.]